MAVSELASLFRRDAFRDLRAKLVAVGGEPDEKCPVSILAQTTPLTLSGSAVVGFLLLGRFNLYTTPERVLG